MSQMNAYYGLIRFTPTVLGSVVIPPELSLNYDKSYESSIYMIEIVQEGLTSLLNHLIDDVNLSIQFQHEVINVDRSGCLTPSLDDLFDDDQYPLKTKPIQLTTRNSAGNQEVFGLVSHVISYLLSSFLIYFVCFIGVIY